MAIDKEEILIEQCKKLIETKLAWGESENWSNQDFEELSEDIKRVTSVNLSTTTLKRIWGKLKYESAPTNTTLNTLAQFVGYENWRSFRQTHISENNNNDKEPGKIIFKKYRSKSVILGLAGFLLLFAVGYLYLNVKNIPLNSYIKGNYKFESRKIVSLGVPNSVVFDYDATASPIDSVFIQQSWDQKLSSRVSRNQHQHTSIYYYPGFFEAKLLVGKQIVKRHNVFIKTDGWLSLIEQKPVPVYFKKEDAFTNGKMGLSISKIKEKNVNMDPVAPYVNYLNIKDFGDLKTNNFIFETSLKSDYNQGASVCQFAQIEIFCENSGISIPLSAKGCISEDNIFCLGQMINGKEHDLSGFGVDFNDYTKVRLEILQGSAKFYVNGKPAYQLDNITLDSKIIGIGYRFLGTGFVDYIKIFKGNGAVVYEDDF
jgi:hypothetical protein